MPAVATWSQPRTPVGRGWSDTVGHEPKLLVRLETTFYHVAMTYGDPTAAEARDRLAAARELATTTVRRGAAVGSITTAASGVLVAGALAAASFFTPQRPIAFTLSFAIYGLALTLLMLWHRRSQVTAAYCVLVGLPMLVTGARMAIGGRR